MIFETNMGIAIKTLEGNYILKNFSAFNLNKINENSTSLNVSFLNNKILSLKIKCIFCENTHYYKYSIGELIRKDMIIGGCDMLGLPILYIGNCKIIENEILKHNKVNTRIYAMI
ncbi:hypothetical protein [Clostridium kluyveri]|uniref:Uncharacterized protein n=2 Tax=Clostridium kluyveri TaxID=1534 RepID=A5N3K3_CLOK5|nr:hypothetical protein [Clostridium kluyveri]EDK35699.1 Conserved hypothetical protein [Clostridium kluyveri DSM 555]